MFDLRNLYYEMGAQGFFSTQIIAILAAILFPVFAKAREKARQAACMSNLKQIALGLKMYVSDYDSRFMCVRQGPGGWNALVQPYLKNWQLLECPSYEYYIRTCGPTTQHGNSSAAGPPWNGVYEGGYMLCGWEQEGCCWPGVKETKFQYPATTYMVVEGDCMGAYWGAFVKDGAPWHHHQYRHNDGLNVAYVDGHVKWIKETHERFQAFDNQTVDYSRTGY